MVGFWEYSESSGDDELEIPDRDASTPDASPPKKKRKQAAAILLDLEADTPEPAKRSDSAAAAAPVEDADDLELARSLAQTQHSGGADARADDDAAAGEQAADGAGAEAERLRQMRAEVLAAFNRDEEDEDDDDDVEETTPAAKSLARRRRRRPSQDVVDIDEDEAAEAELARAREAAMRSVAAGPADEADGALVIRVQCKQGSVQIRQQREENFEELLQKFLKYAVEHKWCSRGAACKLQFDGDGIDPTSDTPEGLDMDTGEAIDALWS